MLFKALELLKIYFLVCPGQLDLSPILVAFLNFIDHLWPINEPKRKR